MLYQNGVFVFLHFCHPRYFLIIMFYEFSELLIPHARMFVTPHVRSSPRRVSSTFFCVHQVFYWLTSYFFPGQNPWGQVCMELTTNEIWHEYRARQPKMVLVTLSVKSPLLHHGAKLCFGLSCRICCALP